MSENPLIRESPLIMWHPHVYKSPPKRLTPFFIQDILKLAGIRKVDKRFICDSSLGDEEEEYEEEEEIPEPLNLSLCHRSHRHANENVVSSKTEGVFPTSSSTSSTFDDDEEDDKKKKKVRTTFTGRQIFELEKMFESKKYLSSSERSEMAKILNVTEQQVKIWFQNQAAEHMKNKKSTSPHLSGHGSSGNSIMNGLGSSLSSSSPSRPSFESLQHHFGSGSVSSDSRPSSSMRSSPPPQPPRHHSALLVTSFESEEDEFREMRRGGGAGDSGGNSSSHSSNHEFLS
ncbi:unnamed protein product [Lepeophtheirus salmonis]|uniref:(salmon louse) hypothetical protein n=1 Tax=Lepeophtheirus salmonis TaxID=72036 RepID=A0A7R8H4R7_LEPSM|nr:unnamed protein product [Lepeophtheirus salmonis]CAF2850556.1 unnamed protein product [Lepeophtheirus salmonis]